MKHKVEKKEKKDVDGKPSGKEWFLGRKEEILDDSDEDEDDEDVEEEIKEEEGPTREQIEEEVYDLFDLK